MRLTWFLNNNKIREEAKMTLRVFFLFYIFLISIMLLSILRARLYVSSIVLVYTCTAIDLITQLQKEGNQYTCTCPCQGQGTKLCQWMIRTNKKFRLIPHIVITLKTFLQNINTSRLFFKLYTIPNLYRSCDVKNRN